MVECIEVQCIQNHFIELSILWRCWALRRSAVKLPRSLSVIQSDGTLGTITVKLWKPYNQAG
jgi:hypothetical protein